MYGQIAPFEWYTRARVGLLGREALVMFQLLLDRLWAPTAVALVFATVYLFTARMVASYGDEGISVRRGNDIYHCGGQAGGLLECEKQEYH